MVLPYSVLAVVVPFCVSGGLAGVLRRGRAGSRFTVLAGVGIGFGFLAGFAGLAGGLPFLASVPHHGVGAVAVLATGAGIVLALIGLGTERLRLIAVVLGLLSAVWAFGFEELDALTLSGFLLVLAGTAVAAGIMLRLVGLAPHGAAPIAIVLIVSLALAVVETEARGGLAGDFALALGAACAGWLVWARPFAKTQAGVAALVISGALLVAIGTDAAHTALHPPWAMALLPFCFWGETIARRLKPVGRLSRTKGRKPYVMVAAACVPAVLAIGVAQALAGLR